MEYAVSKRDYVTQLKFYEVQYNIDSNKSDLKSQIVEIAFIQVPLIGNRVIDV